MVPIMSLGRNGAGFSSSAESGLGEDSPNRSASIPLPMLLLAAAFWILVIMSLKQGLPWGNITFTSSYGGTLIFCYFMTGLTTMKALKLGSKWSRAGEISSSKDVSVGPCSTCRILGELTDGFRDIPPKVEAVYIEHLQLEHEIEP